MEKTILVLAWAVSLTVTGLILVSIFWIVKVHWRAVLTYIKEALLIIFWVILGAIIVLSFKLAIDSIQG